MNFIHYPSKEPENNKVTLSGWKLFKDSAGFIQFRSEVEGKLKLSKVEFEEKWRKVIADFEKWDAEWGSQVSTLNVKLNFLKEVCEGFGEYLLYKDKTICELVLSDTGIKKVGDQTRLGIVVGREISDQFGVLYTTEGPDGQRFTHEFFD